MNAEELCLAKRYFATQSCGIYSFLVLLEVVGKLIAASDWKSISPHSGGHAMAG
jgi:hypothetical protein